MINVTIPQIEPELKPRITVFGVGGAGGNAVNNMIKSNLEGVDFVVGNTDAQALKGSLCEKRIQLGTGTTRGLGAGSKPDVGRASAEEQIDEIVQYLEGSNMVFITAGMGGGTGTGAAPVIARAARERGILTVGVVTKPFHFEGGHRMRLAEGGIAELQQYVDTLIIIPNQNLFRIANEKTTFADAFKMADDVLHSGVRGVTDLMVMPGLINLDFADIRSVMTEMGKAMMGTGEAGGERRAIEAAEAAISNPLLDDVSMKGARGVLINITGGYDMTLFEVDEAANRVRDEVDPDANIIFGSTFDSSLDGVMRVSVVATGIDAAAMSNPRTLHPVNLSLVPGDRTKKPAAPGNLTGAPAAPAGAPGSPIPSTAMGLRTPQPVTAGAAAIQHDPAQQQPVHHAQPHVEAPKPAAGPLHGENQGGHFFAPKPADAGPRQPVTVGAAPLSTPQQPVNQQHAPQAPQMQGHQQPHQPQHQPQHQQPAPMAHHHHAAPQGHQQHPGQQHPGGLSVGPAPAPAPEPAPARKGNFLFGLVTGLGRKSEPAHPPVPQPAPQPAPQAYQPQPAPQQYQPAPQGYPQQPAYPQQPQAPQQGYPQYPAAPQQQPVYPPQSAPQQAPGYPAAPQPQAPAPRADAKPGEQEELDIPAFLRRQAN
ncbi:cell division protein FtsZ [Azospirillum lipoferum]|uniref:Cell division protein FtsZ n=1 Tax=Azospirillum lipoferum TaxID=193 RepID=A0A5A9GX20_AZOLI|nr:MULTISPECIES: cell division protein FtsZ [Azospirillum]KAA0598352.1 cell division protein FtsZ [Azospirillum lipoferum]MCP1609659.1 cell division protein FtsZ [Azospirillum lipoferum]MDW5535034.1 cell division protein FtsZ [Azospirillum sp. NL1]